MLILSPYFVYRPRVEIKLQILRFQLPPPPPPHFLPFPLDKKTEKKKEFTNIKYHCQWVFSFIIIITLLHPVTRNSS